MLPLFPVTVVGSWPRPPELNRAFARAKRGEIREAELALITEAAVREAVRLQEEAGIDVVSDGEQRRDNFYSFVSGKLDGVQLMSLAEMLDVVEDKESFRQLLDSLDVPAWSIHNPTCVGRIRRREPLAAEEVRALRALTKKPIKVALPGPYLLTRAMWVKEVSRAAYPDKESLGADVVQVLREELSSLRELGVEFVQLDEPVLTELVFTQGRPRTFMCAALAARKDPAEELELAVTLINRVLEGFDDLHTGLHVCRGNWSQKEETLLSGSYQPLLPWLERLKVKQLVLEYATPRAGEIVAPVGHELGLGAVNPRTPEVETPAAIVSRVREALKLMPAERIWLNPDCGFGTFASRPMNPPEVAQAKLKALVEAAKQLRSSEA
ncbi:MAG: cobalamin-independent methionine synthase II family protein [Myxococcaceae bacterium]